MNVTTPLHTFHLADLESGNAIDRCALALERGAAFSADELSDPDANMLDEAAGSWRASGRPDRVEFVASLAAETRPTRSSTQIAVIWSGRVTHRSRLDGTPNG